MELDRAPIVDTAFKTRVQQALFPSARSKVNSNDLGLPQIWQLFRSQCVSRHLDLCARWLRAQNKGFYTIGSSGHEGNAAIAAAFDVHDLAFLHYRSGAFVAQRSMMAGQDQAQYIYEQCLSLVASREDPISGGRHKVFGSKALNIPPQTSTIASHGPKAFGSAFALMLAKGFEGNNFFAYNPHAVVLCSFGDASYNHSTLQGAINASLWLANQHTPMPLVWICEDNGIGISVPTPRNWIAQSISNRQGISYLVCDGLNICDVFEKAKVAAHIARLERKPVFLHVRTVRLMGHAGSDVEFHYRSEKEIKATEAQDPLLHTARILHEEYDVTLVDILNQYHDIADSVRVAAQKAAERPRLQSAQDIMQSIVPPSGKNALTDFQSITVPTQPLTMAQSINVALQEVLTTLPQAVVFGEDVAKKGGVYWVTQGLQKRFGARRVFDTLLDEQSILGTAIGLAQSGFIPIAEIQFLAYIHNAIDQIRGEAATQSFFSNGQYTNPMLIRIPSFAYQKGFGGHFHNDNAFAFLREIPGLIIATPSTPCDAASLLKECIQLVVNEQRVVVFLEPIALYHQKDMFKAGDNQFLQCYSDTQPKPKNQKAKYLIISYANGAHLSRMAISNLREQHGIDVAFFDLQWLKPLPEKVLLEQAKDKEAIFIVDECRQTGSISEEIITLLSTQLPHRPILNRLTAKDCFIPLGTAWEHILPSCEDIIRLVKESVREAGCVK